MSDENIISMLTAQTLKPADSAGFPDSESIFQRRREISKLPVHAIDGEFIQKHIVRFNISGNVIDMPSSFGVANFLEGFGGVVSRKEDKAFFDVIGALLSTTIDSVYVVKGSEGNPWLVFWNSKEDKNIESQLTEIFYPPVAYFKAA